MGKLFVGLGGEAGSCFVGREPPVCVDEPIPQAVAGPPARRGQFRDVEQFLWRSVGLARISGDCAGESDDVANELGDVHDGQVFASLDVDVLHSGVDFHQMDEGARSIIDVQEFAPWCAGSPDRDFGMASSFCFMRLAEQSGDDMAGGEIVIIAWPVQVGRHCGDEVGEVLPAVGLAASM